MISIHFTYRLGVGLGQPPFWSFSQLRKVPSASMSDFKKDTDENPIQIYTFFLITILLDCFFQLYVKVCKTYKQYH